MCTSCLPACRVTWTTRSPSWRLRSGRSRMQWRGRARRGGNLTLHAGAACHSSICHLSCHICFHLCMLARIAEAHNCPAACSPWYGPDRPKWLGPLNYSYDTYQTGDAPGDYAYDILQLGRAQKAFERYYELEILHSRWAMLGALGALIPGTLLSQIFSYQRRGCISSAGRKYGMAFARGGNTDGAVPKTTCLQCR